METPLISKISLLDLTSVLRLERVCFGADAWPMLDVISVLVWPRQVRMKAAVDGKTVGLAMAEPDWRDGISMITSIGVDPEFRRRGIGSALLTSCELQLPGEKIRLTVREDNLPAIKLYEQFQYVYLAKVPNYYRDGRAGLVMEKTRDSGRMHL